MVVLLILLILAGAALAVPVAIELEASEIMRLIVGLMLLNQAGRLFYDLYLK